jgi:uncharacterized iron-regulated membrane protein
MPEPVFMLVGLAAFFAAMLAGYLWSERDYYFYVRRKVPARRTPPSQTEAGWTRSGRGTLAAPRYGSVETDQAM